MSGGSWRDVADDVLATLFIAGKPAPTPDEVFEAYPFGMREYTPYRVWLEQIKRWKAAHAAGRQEPAQKARGAKARKREKAANRDASQGKLL